MKKGRKRGLFITLEGPEGSGKSTQARLLFDFFLQKGYKVVHTREPGGTGLAEAIRHILLNPKFHVLPMTELLLYEASRYQHTKELILPNLQKGKIVLCERYTDATCAYQGYGRGIDLKIINLLNNIATEKLFPDLTIYLDISSLVGLDKAKKKSDFINGDRIENESLKFHRKVRRGYLQMARENPERIKVIKVQADLMMTHRKIVDEVMKLVKSFGKSAIR